MLLPVLVALAVSLVMAATWYFTRRRMAAVVAFLWLGYAVYELLMYRRVLCSGECNIRVDLLLIYPILLVVSFRLCSALAVAYFRARRG